MQKAEGGAGWRTGIGYCARHIGLFVLLLGLTGCGYLFVNGPPDNYENLNYVSCTESNVGPVLDFVWAGLNAAGVIAIAADPDSYEDTYDLESGTGIAIGAGWVVLSGSSAIVGSNKVSDCKKAKREIADRQAERRDEQSGEGPNAIEQSLYQQMLEAEY